MDRMANLTALENKIPVHYNRNGTGQYFIKKFYSVKIIANIASRDNCKYRFAG